ncbi:MAG: hypothetical protein CL908_10375 [Deltaproteobacteria bacterium]|nr:hypothetical protein [Deltaproteobacteria bacterium]
MSIMGRAPRIRWLALLATCSLLAIGSPLAATAGEPRREPTPASIPPEVDPALAEARKAVRLRDFEKAVRLWREAARRGDAHAQYRLGVAYRTARGVEQDPVAAARWFTKAAANGDLDARFALAKLFESGLGVEQDRQRAIEHLVHAARRGHKRSTAALERMQKTQSIAYSTADPRIAAHDRDPREALAQAIRLGDPGAAREALARGAPINGAPGDERHARPLILAIELSRPKLVKLLFEHGADPDRRSRIGEPALIVAIRQQGTDLARLLLRAGASPHAVSTANATALMEAARLGKSRVVGDLLSAGADARAMLPDGTSAADVARRFGFDTLAARLHRAGAPNLDDREDAGRLALLSSVAGDGDANTGSTLAAHLEAARRGDVELLREMKSGGMALDARSPDGDHALHLAADGGHGEALSVLLEVGMGVDVRGREDATPLMRAMASVQNGSVDVLERLLRAGADPHLRDRKGAPVIDYAATGGTQRKLALLRSAGGSWTDRDASPTLARATAGGPLSAVEALIEAVSDPANRVPALCNALAVERTEALDPLLRAGVSLDSSCGDGRGPLMVAVLSGRLDHVDRLLDAGADPLLANESGDNALISAASRGEAEITERLIAAGADVDWRGAHRMTALMGAASNGHVDVARILLAADADRRMRGETDQTAADLAQAAGHPEIATLIEGSGPAWRRWLGSSGSPRDPSAPR